MGEAYVDGFVSLKDISRTARDGSLPLHNSVA